MPKRKWSKPCVAELDIQKTELIFGDLATDAGVAWLLSLIDGGHHHHSVNADVS